jgi:hypothetical protein
MRGASGVGGLVASLVVATTALGCGAEPPFASTHDAGPRVDTGVSGPIGFVTPMTGGGGGVHGQGDAGPSADTGSHDVPQGCVPPQGDGEKALCAPGLVGFVRSDGLFGSQPQCCPCTVADCGTPGCCADPVCQGSPLCAGLRCHSLSDTCHGMQNFDCDDFPEDCDMPCCACTSCF